MIQQIDAPKHSNSSRPAPHQTTSDVPDFHWGHWHGQRHYSLEVIQHPVRARMCGFGDKDRRPLAPAAVAKMVVRRRDDSIVDVDDVDCSFFLVTVDLWSADGKQDMNLVLHPSSTDRSSVPPTKTRRTGPTIPLTPSRSSGHQTPSSQAPAVPAPYRTGEQNLSNQSYYPPNLAEPSFPPSSQFGPASASATSETPQWGASYPPQSPQVDRNTSFPSHGTSTARPMSRSQSNATESWSHSETEPEALPYRAWAPDAACSQPSDQTSNSHIDPALRGSSTNADSSVYSSTSAYQAPPPPPYYSSSYPPTVQVNPQLSASSIPTRNTYTRTLIGPLSANACRLLDEHRKPGIFFLFQDLSVRTEGTFRLRLRLMNVGAPPAPEAGAAGIHNDVSPVLAQVFTEPFVVYSAKRFPGVPDTTALSIALGNQGQKLPLRNRHGSSKRRRQNDSDSEEESDGA